MRRPTDELVSYLAAQSKREPEVVRHHLYFGRLAMALEVITVVKIIEEYSLLATKEDTISVLQTLIVDQELMDDATEWYHKLCDWRRIKLDDAAYEVPDVQPSERAAPGDVRPRLESIRALLDTGQTKDPPSDD